MLVESLGGRRVDIGMIVVDPFSRCLLFQLIGSCTKGSMMAM